MFVDVSARYVKLGGIPPDTPSLVSSHQDSLFNITDLYHCDLMHPSKISVHSSEWGPAKVLPFGPALAKAGPA